MPLAGTLDLTDRVRTAPQMPNTDAEPWEIEGVELLHVSYEIDDRHMTSVLPPALHPTIPPTVYFSVARYPDSPVGAFMLAQVRAGCRAATLPRGFLLRAYTDSPRAAEALAANWGYNCDIADVRLNRRYERIEGIVRVDGREVLNVALLNPEPISGGDIQYVANMNLARLPDDNGRGALIQVDPEYRFHRADRGRPQIVAFDREAWHARDVDPVDPIVASCVVCDTGFPRIRYVLDPTVPAMAGTRKVGG